MKYLITGVSGFVGKHVINYLLSSSENIIFGIDSLEANVNQFTNNRYYFKKVSLSDFESIKEIIANFAPDRIVHLASRSSVAYSWHDPVDCFQNNTNIFLNLIEAVRKTQIKCKVLSVGSSEEYGAVDANLLPVDEKHPLNPLNPYAASRVAQENLSRIYASGYDIDIVCSRSFNHLGPGQSDSFVASSFVKQALEYKMGSREEIICGDIKIVRDFIDVRDVVRAYLLILEFGEIGSVYNVCSGFGLSLHGLLNKIFDELEISPPIVIDQNLIRPVENSILIGDNSKLKKLGFSAAITIEESIRDIIDYWSGVINYTHQ